MNTFTVTLNLRFNRTNKDNTPDTDAFFTKTSIAEYIKTITSPEKFVEYITDQYVVSGNEKWGDGFSVTFKVETTDNRKGVYEALNYDPLDGEYDARTENGWVIYTKGNDKKSEYGLVDYRDGGIIIE